MCHGGRATSAVAPRVAADDATVAGSGAVAPSVYGHCRSARAATVAGQRWRRRRRRRWRRRRARGVTPPPRRRWVPRGRPPLWAGDAPDPPRAAALPLHLPRMRVGRALPLQRQDTRAVAHGGKAVCVRGAGVRAHVQVGLLRVVPPQAACQGGGAGREGGGGEIYGRRQGRGGVGAIACRMIWWLCPLP